jgi:hypothetical protein
MKKNYFFKSFLLLIPISAILLLSFSSGANLGSRTGSPGDGGNTCTVCHAPGANFNASAMITTNIPGSGYDVDTDYIITVTATSTAPGHGFQLTAERLSDNAKIGSFTAGTGSMVVNGGTHINHSNSSQNSWTFTWRSPSTLQGQVRFYASVNAVNNNGSNGGDQVITAVSEPQNALGISEARRLDFKMFPNPSTDVVNIQLPAGTVEATVGIFDYTGRMVSSKTVTTSDQQVEVNNLAVGMYMIRVTSDDKIGAQRFIKQ